MREGHTEASRGTLLIQTKWRGVGCELGLSAEELDTIEKRSGDWLNRCFSDVFDTWRKQGTPPYTWASIIRALRAPQVKEIDLSRKLEKKFARMSQLQCCSFV